jgi:hypothetical protein
MPLLNREVGPLWDLDTFFLFDHFAKTLVAGEWATTLTDLGTAAVGDASRGILTITPADASVTDNDEAYVASTKQLFLFAASRPLYAKGRLQFTETAAGIYNAFFGFVSGVGADTLVDNGGGMRASGCIAAIHKIDGETVWRCTTRNGATTTTTVSTTTAGGAAYQDLDVIGQDADGVNLTFTFKVNGVYLRDVNGLVIRHSVPIASASLMSLAFGAKLGAITNNDVLNVDYAYGAQHM